MAGDKIDYETFLANFDSDLPTPLTEREFNVLSLRYDLSDTCWIPKRSNRRLKSFSWDGRRKIQDYIYIHGDDD